MPGFTFLSPTRIVFGDGVADEVGRTLLEFGKRPLIVASAGTLTRTPTVERVTTTLTEAGCRITIFDEVHPEPNSALVHRGAQIARSEASDVVLAIGGGSAMDLAKAIAVAATHEGSVDDYVLPAWGGTLPITSATLPVVTVPTTAGTGSEVTNSAVIRHDVTGRKQVLASEWLFPRAAHVDPCLLLSLSLDVTIATAMDSLAQSIEAYVSRYSQPIVQLVALEGIRLVLRFLPAVSDTPTSTANRSQLALAALLSGIAIVNAGVGVTHSLAMGLGSRHDVPHGRACGIFLPYAMQVNAALVPDPYARLSVELNEDIDARAGSDALAVARVVQDLQRTVGFNYRLRDVGVRPDEAIELAKSARNPDMMGNPADLSDEHLLSIIHAAM